jgi:hypothetical protein
MTFTTMAKLSSEQRAELVEHLRALERLLGGGEAFVIHRNAQGGYALAGTSADLLAALEAVGGGLGSLAMTLGTPSLVEIAQALIDTAHRARALQRKGQS